MKEVVEEEEEREREEKKVKQRRPKKRRTKLSPEQREACVCRNMSSAMTVAIRGHPFRWESQAGKGEKQREFQSFPCFSLWN